MSSPLVSIAISVYNGATYLAEAIESALAQTAVETEVLVIDDGSTDRSAEIARSYSKVRYEYQTNAGNAAARNRGIALARAEWVALLDQDDRWRPEKLQVQLAAMAANPTARWASCHAELLRDPNDPLPPGYRPDVYDKPFPAYLPSALMLHREATERVGLFDTSLAAGNDSDWFFRAMDAGVPGVICPQVLMDKRVHAANQGNDLALMKRDLMRVVRASLLRKRAAAGRAPGKDE